MNPREESPRDKQPDEWPRSVIADSPTGLPNETPSRPRTVPAIAWFALGLLALVVAALAVVNLGVSSRPPAKADATTAAAVVTPLTQRTPP